MTNPTNIVTDTLAGSALVYSNEAGDDYRFTPETFQVRVSCAALQEYYGTPRIVRLDGPPGWLIDEPERRVLPSAREYCWRVQPYGEPTTCRSNLRLEIQAPDGHASEIVLAVSIEIRGRTQFARHVHSLPWANSATELGEIEPAAAVFAQTYRRSGALGRVFFEGLYSQVVYLTSDTTRSRPGGLCTGMARLSLEHSLRNPGAASADDDGALLRADVALWHGRQLADRALIASTLAWLTQGSREAYATFRQQVLSVGRSELAMDLNVPRPWRRDILSAFIGNGHTVVPYALRQTTDEQAQVWVYDPNFPHEPEASRSVVEFDLARNTFRYRTFRGDTPGRPSKVIAVAQTHYRQARTGYIAGLLSAILYPHTWWSQRRVMVIVSVFLAGLALLSSRRRRHHVDGWSA